ncbi:MAG: hypothetical protein H0V91_15705 [Flavisolibacter sp.]|nr:hypothetical protein [Flavisolibacter sp.]
MTLPDQLPAPTFRSRLSFAPLLKRWQNISIGDSAQGKICQRLLHQFNEQNELLKPIDDYGILIKNSHLVEEAMMTVFPLSFITNEKLYAAGVPFSDKVIHASPLFQKMFLDEENNNALKLEKQVEQLLADAKLNLSYKLILKKFYNIDIPFSINFICAYPDEAQGISNYFELEWDYQFIEVSTSEPLPVLSDEVVSACLHVSQLVNYLGLLKELPIEQFLFDGFTIVHVHEVTERESVQQIKQILEKGNILDDKDVMKEVGQQVRYLLQIPDLQLGITSYDQQDKVLNYFNDTSFLLNHIPVEFHASLCDEVARTIKASTYYECFINKLEEEGPVKKYLSGKGLENVFLLSLQNKNQLIGWLELASSKPIKIDVLLVEKLHKVILLVQDCLLKNQQAMHSQVDQLIKEHFTAVQESVEWKFKKTAFEYMRQQQRGIEPKMQTINFTQVYPLFGMIDIRNSSGVRNLALQKDLLLQLKWVKQIIEYSYSSLHLPILQELELRLDGYINAVNNFLFASDEQLIQNFLRTEAAEILLNLKDMDATLLIEVDAYFKAVNNNRNIISESQYDYEQSVTKINNLIVHLLENEQKEAQAIYPHYFERFVSDGVEFNMYIGQSITPGKNYNNLFLKNLRLWQFRFIAQAAQQVKRLSHELPVPLETTQLILAYDEPLSISFRSAERKFDVDGVYNARYEVIKKRIDKAHLKDSQERLTKTDHIAIVYNSDKQVQEYQQYFQYLKALNLLSGEIEMLELEELQGVNGLKALRVQIAIEEETEKILKNNPSQLFG